MKNTARNRKSSMAFALASALAMATMSLPAMSADWWTTMPKTVIGHATVSVTNFGAKGNGVHDDTAAFQAAINSLPTTGGTVTVPAGVYMINALKSINMRSNTRLLMSSNTELHAIPNSSTRYYVIKINNVSNVRVVGGNIIGDRVEHKGTTGEWGMGIGMSAAHTVTIKGIHISNCWGDGIIIGAIGTGTRINRSSNVTIDSVVSNNNRRQGLSITPATHVYVVNSTFSNTNGTLPMAGIDIEPQTQGPTDNIRMEKVQLTGNRGNGLEMHANISNITLTSSTLKNNHGFGALSVSAPYLTMTSNLITTNGLSGVRLSAGAHNIVLSNNTITYNSTNYMSPTKKGGTLSRDLQVVSSVYNFTNIGNTFTPKK